MKITVITCTDNEHAHVLDFFLVRVLSSVINQKLKKFYCVTHHDIEYQKIKIVMLETP